jgi:Tfp pilus assembly protein PilF
MIEKEDETLQGWNAIAAHLACDVRTAKRWEERRRLPVRRVRWKSGDGRANVYALVSEIDLWRAECKMQADPDDLLDVPEPRESESDLSGQETAGWRSTAAVTRDHADTMHVATTTARYGRRHWRLAASLGIVGVCLSLATIALWGRDHRAAARTSEPGEPAQPSHEAAAASSGGGGRAEELYLHGSYLFEQRTPETLEQAKTDFEQAIAANPGYAAAYAGLAETYDLLREYSQLPSTRAYPLAKEAAERAIALDPKLPEAHAALGYEEFFWEWDAVKAEREFKTAIGLDPNCAVALHWYGAMLMHQRRFDEALAQLDRAQMLQPASAGVLASRAYTMGLNGKRDEAADTLQDILTRVPDAAPLHFILAQLSLQEPRDIPRYLDQMRRFAELSHNAEQIELIRTAEPVYQQQGETAMWRAMLERERRLHPPPEHPTYFMAQLESTLGMNDDALRDLAQLEKDHDSFMIGLDIDHMLKPLHGDPRFEQVLDRMGLPDTERGS